MNELLETWDSSARISVYVLRAVAPEALSVQSGRARSVGDQFAHVHNVRLMWLQSAAPDLAASLSKIEKGAAVDANTIAAALESSAMAIRALVERALSGSGKVKGFKPHASAFVGYLIAHEAHHRGQIVLLLKQAGFPLDKKILFGMWEWGVR